MLKKDFRNLGCRKLKASSFGYCLKLRWRKKTAFTSLPNLRNARRANITLVLPSATQVAIIPETVGISASQKKELASGSPTRDLAQVAQAVIKNNAAIEQIIGREGETAILYERRSLNLKLRVIGFAPRQLNRWLSRGKINVRF